MKPILSIFLLLAFGSLVHADERLAGIACRSVHLGYQAPPGAAFYNEVIVDESAPGTYFCVCGFSKGYYGIQELVNKKKVVIFSVWDPGNQNDPKSVDEDKRVKLLHQGEGVRIGRFGNEGTGGQSFYDLDWKAGETYRFLVAAKPSGERTEFAGWLYLNDKKEWKHLVTFSTITGGKSLDGYYSFVEDFRRNRESAKLARVARYGHGGVIDRDGKWHGFTSARFTGDSNPATNINAGQRDGLFFLATGGETKNADTKLKESIKLSGDAAPKPDDLPEFAKKADK